MSQLDKETQKVMNEGSSIAELVKSEAWLMVRNIIEDKILDLQSVMNINADNPEEAVIDIRSRRTAVEILVEFLKEVEGRAEQHQMNKEVIPTGDYVLRK